MLDIGTFESKFPYLQGPSLKKNANNKIFEGIKHFIHSIVNRMYKQLHVSTLAKRIIIISGKSAGGILKNVYNNLIISYQVIFNFNFTVLI